MDEVWPDEICGAWLKSKLLDSSPGQEYILITKEGRFARVTDAPFMEGATLDQLKRMVDSKGGSGNHTEGWQAWIKQPDYGRPIVQTLDIETGEERGCFLVYEVKEHYRQLTPNGEVESAPGDLAMAEVYPLFMQNIPPDVTFFSVPPVRLFHCTRLPQF